MFASDREVFSNHKQNDGGVVGILIQILVSMRLLAVDYDF